MLDPAQVECPHCHRTEQVPMRADLPQQREPQVLEVDVHPGLIRHVCGDGTTVLMGERDAMPAVHDR